MKQGDLRTPAQLERLTDEQLLEYLAELAPEIQRIKERQEALWKARIEVYLEGRRREPPITHGRLAVAAKVSEVAIITKLRQLEERESEEAAAG